MNDSECICQGNLREIVKESELFFDKTFINADGVEYKFFGIVFGSDDFYYGLHRAGVSHLYSCVGSLKNHGFTVKEEQ